MSLWYLILFASPHLPVALRCIGFVVFGESLVFAVEFVVESEVVFVAEFERVECSFSVGGDSHLLCTQMLDRYGLHPWVPVAIPAGVR